MAERWQNVRVLVIGAARQGQALARYLAIHGARVTLNDQRPAQGMSTARAALADVPLNWALGGHPLELLDGQNLVCISGGVPLSLPIVAEALRRGLPLTNDTQIFLEAVPCRTVGITGSAGKTTTTTLVGLMAERGWPGRAWVGGNIGDPLLNHVDEMGAGDLAIIEISSFQLEQMTVSPKVAAVLNVTPNHLDRHGTLEAYTAAKARILDFQSADGIAVLGREDPGAWGLRDRAHGRLLSFGFGPLPAGQEGAFMDGDTLRLREGGEELPLARRDQIQLRGAHNLLNVLAAGLIARAAGLPVEAMRAAIADFRGVPHRLEFVREWRGARWYNDSIATAPERSMAAIRSFEEPLVLLLGGRDKDLPWQELAELAHARVDHVVLFGEAAGKIAAALGEVRSGKRLSSIVRCAGLEQAVQAAAAVAAPGDVILLAPGGTSFDEFKDFEERGERYCTWVHALS